MSYRVVNLFQGSREWHEFRLNHLGASEIAAVLGKCPYKTRYELYLEKTGMPVHRHESEAMREGQRMEPLIRQWFESETGIALMPQVIESIENPWLSASLDGISIDGDIFVEIKFNSKNNHQLAKNGLLSDHHMLQMQHQWGVLGHVTNRKAYYISHHNGENVLVEVRHDARIWDEIVQEGEKFWNLVQHKTPPELTDDDYELIDNPELLGKAVQLEFILAERKELEKREAEIRKEIIDKVGRNARIGKMQLSKVVKAGLVQYDQIPELIGVDLEKYRKSPSQYWTLREVK